MKMMKGLKWLMKIISKKIDVKIDVDINAEDEICKNKEK